jgi:hypothetical protein
METVLCISLGVGLSAASGFRVFVPLLFMSIASLSGHLALANGFQWIGTYPSLIVFSVATCLEVAAYYVPFISHLLDLLTTPSAIVAGAIISASVITDISPLTKWTLAIIAGGGAAGVVQGSTVMLRGASTAATAGFGTPIVATLELAGAVITSVLALTVPLVVAGLLLATLVFIGVYLLRQKNKAFQRSRPVG